MKRVMQSGLLIGLLSFCLYTPSAQAQESSTEPALKEGKVWSVEYIRTKSGKSEEYKKYLAKNYMKTMNAAKKDGLISDFILLESSPGNRDDWDIMILVAVNKYGDLDGMDERFEKLRKEKFGEPSQEAKDAMDNRYALREITGGKMARQLELK